MATLLQLHSLSQSHGNDFLFEDISFSIHQGDRIGIIGPNGAGKSTLLKVLMGLQTQDAGNITKKQNLRIGYASQSPEFPDLTLEEILLDGKTDEERKTRARILLSKAKFSDPACKAKGLSGGWKKRLDIVRALMDEPDLLLLDEPTNHLDIEGIQWLEKLLTREKVSFVVVSHDRDFLENVCTSTLELNRCYPEGIFMSDCKLSEFFELKVAFIEGQIQMEHSLRSTVKEEVAWLRKSPKARTTKSRSRMQKAYELQSELANLSHRNKKVVIDVNFSASERETKKLIACKNLCKSIDGRQLFKGIDILLSPKSRLGIVGKNGTGKTTLLKMIAGKIPQDMGTIKYADDLKIVYFDQHRDEIPPNISLKEALSPNSEFVNYRGNEIHVHGWAKKFLFPEERLQLPVRLLSGGEKARIFIAKLMLEPADILLLDEPTNDLDIDTLEIIEESLREFTGSVVLISHDRSLMANVCNQILALGLGDGDAKFFTDFRQYEKLSSELQPKKEVVSKVEKPVQEKKLSYKEQRELSQMEESILKVETEIGSLQQELNLYGANPTKSVEIYTSLAIKQKQHEELFQRWQHLLNLSSTV